MTSHCFVQQITFSCYDDDPTCIVIDVICAESARWCENAVTLRELLCQIDFLHDLLGYLWLQSSVDYSFDLIDTSQLRKEFADGLRSKS